jgi:hypothetical protein
VTGVIAVQENLVREEAPFVENPFIVKVHAFNQKVKPTIIIL